VTYRAAGENFGVTKKKTAANASKTNDTSQIQTDAPDRFCIKMPIIKPTAANTRGHVLMIRS
jgi:hypothetical protein